MILGMASATERFQIAKVVRSTFRERCDMVRVQDDIFHAAIYTPVAIATFDSGTNFIPVFWKHDYR